MELPAAGFQVRNAGGRRPEVWGASCSRVVWQLFLRRRDISDQVAREGYSGPPGLRQPKTQDKAARANRLAVLGFAGQDSGRVAGKPDRTRFSTSRKSPAGKKQD
jgi:hypothetical protein